MGRSESELIGHYDPWDPELAEHFWAALAHAREHCPISHSDAHGGFWVLSRYEEIWRVAQDWQTFCSSQGASVVRPENFPIAIPLEIDPPMHRHYRRWLNPEFTPEAVSRYESGIQEVVDDIVRSFADRETCDLVSEFAHQVPAMVFFRVVLGCPPEDLPKVRQWTNALIFGGGNEEQLRANEELPAYAYGLLAKRWDGPRQDDLLDVLVHGEVDGRRVTQDEAIRTLMILILGGLDTTSYAIANICRRIAEDEGLRARLAGRLDDLDEAIEEFLRFESPAVSVARTLTQDTELGGVPLKAGEKVLLVLASANRDAAAFTAPDTIDIERDRNRHLAFGAGPHHCIGSNLARLQIAVALRTLLSRFPNFALLPDTEVSYTNGLARGPRALPVTLR